MKDPAMPGAADRATTLEEQLKDCRRQLKAARRELREYRREERELERLADMAAAPNHPDPTKPTIERYMRYASIAPGLAVSSAFSASVRMPDGGTTVSLGWKWSDRSGRVVLRHVAVEDPDGVRIRDIQRLPIDKAIRSHEPELFAYTAGETGLELYGPLPRWSEVLGSVDFEELRSSGPSPATLAWVARMNAVGLLRHGPRNRLICDSFGIPVRTASHWLTLSRHRVEVWDSRLLPVPVTVHTEMPPAEAAEAAMKILLGSVKPNLT